VMWHSQKGQICIQNDILGEKRGGMSSKLHCLLWTLKAPKYTEGSLPTPALQRGNPYLSRTLPKLKDGREGNFRQTGLLERTINRLKKSHKQRRERENIKRTK